MALSSDPDKRARQLETLAAGRRIREERKAAGLPSKSSERRRGRVVDGSYDKPAAKPAAGRKEPARGKASPSGSGRADDAGAGAEPGRVVRFLGRVMGID